MTPDVIQFISACLDEDERERVKKQRHTARRIYQRLVEECGFSGSESSVRNLVHDMRAARRETKAFVPLKFAPGEAVQISKCGSPVLWQPVMSVSLAAKRNPWICSIICPFWCRRVGRSGMLVLSRIQFLANS